MVDWALKINYLSINFLNKNHDQQSWVKINTLNMDLKAGLHDRQRLSRFTAKVAERVRHSRAATQCTDVPHWVSTSALRPTCWDSDSVRFKCRGRQLAPLI